MKKFFLMLLALSLALGAALPALAEDGVIRVSGRATVALAADIAVIQVGVNTRKPTVQEAQVENTVLMNGVIAAILETGVEEKDIITSQFDVYSAYEYGTDDQGRETSTPCYQVSNMLSVTIRDLSRLGAVLDAAMNAGANTTYGIRFSSSKENDAYQKALIRAVEDAQQKAIVLAAAAGRELGELKLIDATQQNSHYGISNTFDAKAAFDTAAIVSGDISVNATVVIEYSIK